MTARTTVIYLLAAAATTVALAPSALASPAGSEYLPKVPDSGSHSSGSGSGGTETTGTGFGETTGTPTTTSAHQDAKKPKAKKKKESKPDRSAAVPVSSDSGGSSGSGLLSPVFILLAVALIALVIWVVRRRMLARTSGGPAKPRPVRGEIAKTDNAP